jgi:acyl carrier protein
MVRPGFDDCYDVVLVRDRDAESGSASSSWLPGSLFENDEKKQWSAYANNPVRGMQAQALGSELRRFVRSKLPEYMIPATFVSLDSLPLTPNGKVDLHALPAPDWSRLAIRETYTAPRNPTEESIAAIWTQLLGIERVGACDNFFELGGHSLLAIRVLSRVRDTFHVDLTLRAFFEAPTIAGLAELIERAPDRDDIDESSEIVRISRQANMARLSPSGDLSTADLAKGIRRQLKVATTTRETIL